MLGVAGAVVLGEEVGAGGAPPLLLLVLVLPVWLALSVQAARARSPRIRNAGGWIALPYEGSAKRCCIGQQG